MINNIVKYIIIHYINIMIIEKRCEEGNLGKDKKLCLYGVETEQKTSGYLSRGL